MYNKVLVPLEYLLIENDWSKCLEHLGYKQVVFGEGSPVSRCVPAELIHFIGEYRRH